MGIAVVAAFGGEYAGGRGSKDQIDRAVSPFRRRTRQAVVWPIVRNRYSMVNAFSVSPLSFRPRRNSAIGRADCV